MEFTEYVYETRTMGCLQIYRPKTKTILYGSKCINARSIDIWNSINKIHNDMNLDEKSRSICKDFVSKYLINEY